MHSFTAPNWRSPRHAVRLAMLAIAVSPLTACANSVPVAVPVAIKPVSAKLMAAPGIPRCTLDNKPDYSAAEVVAYAECWKAAYHALAARHVGLQRAIAVRERAAARAVAASKS